MSLRTLLLGAGVCVLRCDSAIDTGDIPAQPDAGQATSANVSTFAVNALFLGEQARDGSAPSNNAWREFGYDLDGVTTTKDSTDVCTLATSAPKLNQLDGVDGIDNAFGSVLLPILQSAFETAQPSIDATSRIADGGWTLELQVTGLSGDPRQTAVGLGAQAFLGGAFSGTPAFDLTTDWPVASSSLSDGTTIAGGALVRFDTVYVSAGTLVARDATQPLKLPVQLIERLVAVDGGPLPSKVLTLEIVIHRPVIIVALGGSINEPTAGTVAGLLDTQEVIDVVHALASRAASGLCGSAFDGIAQQLSQAQDILADGTNAAKTPCTAISIGLGFTVKLIANPTQIDTDAQAPPNPCADAGPG